MTVHFRIAFCRFVLYIFADTNERGETTIERRTRATILGIGAIVVWSLMVGLIRTTTSTFGPELGTALIYTVGTVLLFVVNRPTPLRQIPRRYLLVGGTLFVAYEVLFALAIGFAATPGQSIEVSMLNYLWPTLTVVFWAIAYKKRRPASVLWIVPGALVATAGIVLAVAGDELVRTGTLFAAVTTNPLPYIFAGVAAVLWGLYNTVTPRLSQGANATAYFFCGIAVSLWIVFVARGCPMPVETSVQTLTPLSVIPLLAAAAAVATGYALWGYGIVHGDMRKLSVASYSAPVLSGISSSIILATVPGPVFWVGAVLVAAGSVLSWLGSKRIV